MTAAALSLPLEAAPLWAGVRQRPPGVASSAVKLLRLVHGGAVQRRVRRGEVVVYAVFAGTLEVSSRALRGVLAAGDVVVLGEPGLTELTLSSEADVAQAVVPRGVWAQVQSTVRAAPDVILPDTPVRALLSTLIETVSEPSVRDALGRSATLSGAAEQLLLASLAEALAAWSVDAGRGARLPVLPGPLKRATDHIRAHVETACDLETLAEIAGVSGRTLRRSFLDVLGKTATRYHRDMRLALTRERLKDPREPRSVQEIARAVGFGNYTSFWRAYDEAYGENPSETRARAFRRPRLID